MPLQDTIALFFWSLEAAAYASIFGIGLWIAARLLRWRVGLWPILIGCVAFFVGRVWA